MLDDKQLSLVRPKAVPSMFTPVLPPNYQSSTMIQSTNRISQQTLTEMNKIIRKYDREATRLYDCIGQVKVFSYNSHELHWENSANIEGNICVYGKQQVMNNQISSSYAFAVINGDQILIQPITSDMAQHADKLRLFYEVARNGRREVFCLHFLNESECLRLHTFLDRCIQGLRNTEEQQKQTFAISSSVPNDSQAQLSGQATSAMSIQQTASNIYRQQMLQQPIILPNRTTPQLGSSRVDMNQTTPCNVALQPLQTTSYPPQMPLDLLNTNLAHTTPTIPLASAAQIEVPKAIEQTPFPASPIPLTNGNNNNNNTEDPTSSLKRLLNIHGQNPLENLSLDDSSSLPQQNLLDLMPPSAFEPIPMAPSSPIVAIGAERLKHRASNQVAPVMNREHFRNVLLHLVQNDDRFLDIIYQACLTYPATSQ